ncbi:MAG: type II toxin-antitoxin system HicA family toxin [Candidatus Sabulitectum sp.]|nr:type II toxin-antitoxin system HicA family toxin [Candidatus Sabulitectum sp.]
MSKKEKLLQKMLAKPPEIAFGEFESFMEMHGWVKDRQKGSHAIFISQAGEMLTVPQKHGKLVRRTYIILALKQLGLESK